MRVTTPLRSVKLDRLEAAAFRRDVIAAAEPLVLRGLASTWPAVAATRISTDALLTYLAQFDRGATVAAFVGPPEIAGRFFYGSGQDGFNFERRQGGLLAIARAIANRPEPGAPSVYVGSTPVAEVLPGFERENQMPLLPAEIAPRVWIGNRTVVSTHFDESENAAVVVAGRRRFTLFPPDQVSNLYVGPLDVTMAGQPASMVDLRDPDLVRFPRFADALAAARTADLEPGDAIYIPTGWWHNVEALEPFNMLVNYWWSEAPPGAGSAFEAMIHGLYSIAHLPPAQRSAWRAMFDHYVFRADGFNPAAHLPSERQGILGKPSAQLHERIRQFLLRMLSR